MEFLVIGMCIVQATDETSATGIINGDPLIAGELVEFEFAEIVAPASGSAEHR